MSLLDNARGVNRLRKELEEMQSENFIEGRIIHEKTNYDKTFLSNDKMAEALYRFMTYMPS